MEQQTNQPSTLYRTFGILSLVLGLIAFLISFIPCLGMYALFPGACGIIFGVISLVLAIKVSGSKGVVIAGLLLSFIGTAVAAWQYDKIGKAVKEVDKVLKDDSLDLKKLKTEVDSSLNALDSSATNALDSARKK